MANLFRKVPSVETPHISKYEHFGFFRNPFPPKPGVMFDSPDARENGSIYLPELRENEEKKFEQLMVPHPDQPQVKPITFLMDYATRRGRGIGKTAFLQQQRKRINIDHGYKLSSNTQVMFAIYLLPSPDGRTSKFWQFLKMLVNTLVTQNIVAQAMWRLRAFSGCIPENVLDNIGDNLEETIGNDKWLHDQGVDIQFTLRPAIVAQLLKIGLNRALVDSLASYGHSSIDFEENIIKKISDFSWKKEAGYEFFNSIIKLLREAGFTKGLVFVDEVEKIVTPQNTQERKTLVESLRYYFIDGQSESAKYSFLNLLLTIHPYVQELLSPHWETAGLDRFASLSGDQSEQYTIYFDPLKEEFAEPLAMAYLDASRINEQDKGKLDPFTKEAIDEALFRSGRVPGIFLTILSNTVETAIQAGLTSIEKHNVSEVANSSAPKEQKEPDVPESLSSPIVNLED